MIRNFSKIKQILFIFIFNKIAERDLATTTTTTKIAYSELQKIQSKWYVHDKCVLKLDTDLQSLIYLKKIEWYE